MALFFFCSFIFHPILFKCSKSNHQSGFVLLKDVFVLIKCTHPSWSLCPVCWLISYNKETKLAPTHSTSQEVSHSNPCVLSSVPYRFFFVKVTKMHWYLGCGIFQWTLLFRCSLCTPAANRLLGLGKIAIGNTASGFYFCLTITMTSHSASGVLSFRSAGPQYYLNKSFPMSSHVSALLCSLRFITVTHCMPISQPRSDQTGSMLMVLCQPTVLTFLKYLSHKVNLGLMYQWRNADFRHCSLIPALAFGCLVQLVTFVSRNVLFLELLAAMYMLAI